MSEIYEDFKKYRDKFGLNSINSNDRPDCVTQNGALFTMEYLLCLILNKAPEVNDEIDRLQEVFQSLEPRPGLSVRFPGSYEFDSMDNIGALLTFSLLFGSRKFAARMRLHGVSVDCKGVDNIQDADKNYKFFTLARIVSFFQCLSIKPKNYWNTEFPECFCFNGWYGRSPGMMGWLDITVADKSTWLRTLGLFIGQMLSIRAAKGNTDAWKLPYVMWWYLKDRGKIWAWGFKYWKKKLLEMYPGGMKEVYSLYYQDPSHPIREYSIRSF